MNVERELMAALGRIKDLERRVEDIERRRPPLAANDVSAMLRAEKGQAPATRDDMDAMEKRLAVSNHELSEEVRASESRLKIRMRQDDDIHEQRIDDRIDAWGAISEYTVWQNGNGNHPIPRGVLSAHTAALKTLGRGE